MVGHSGLVAAGAVGAGGVVHLFADSFESAGDVLGFQRWCPSGEALRGGISHPFAGVVAAELGEHEVHIVGDPAVAGAGGWHHERRF